MSDRQKLAFIILGITILGAAFRLYGIMEQPPLSDEINMAFTAQGYIERGHSIPSMPHHPNLRNLLVFVSIKIFGLNGFGIRFFSLLFGILSVPLIGMLLYKLSADITASALAAFFLAVDPLSITFSRQTIQEVYVAFFPLLGIYLVLLSMDCLEKGEFTEKRGLFLLSLAGIAFGLGIASKYNTSFILLVGLSVAIYRTLRAGRISLTIFTVLCLIVLPATVFLLTDAPWFGRGYGLNDWLFMKKALFERMTSKFMPPVTETNPDKAAWEWFINPLVGYSSFSISEGKKILSVGMGNPVVWLLVIPSSIYLAFKPLVRKRSAILQGLFWCSYLPFVATTQRPIFFLSAVAVAPFAFGMVSFAISDIIGTARRKLLLVYIGLVLVVSILLFPLCKGKALEYRYTAILTERFSPHR